MSRYRKVLTRIWEDDKFPFLGCCSQRLFLYHLTSPRSSPFGLYVEGPGSMADTLRLTPQQLAEAMAELGEEGHGLVWYARDGSNLVFLPNFLTIPENAPANRSVISHWVKLFRDLPKTSFRSRAVRHWLSLAPSAVPAITWEFIAACQALVPELAEAPPVQAGMWDSARDGAENTQGVGQGVGHGVGQGVRQDLPQGAGQGGPQGVPDGVGHGVGHGVPHGVGQQEEEAGTGEENIPLGGIQEVGGGKGGLGGRGYSPEPSQKPSAVHIGAQGGRRLSPRARIKYDDETVRIVGVVPEDLVLWRRLYPAVDIEKQLEQAALYLHNHPERRVSNIAQFVANWLRIEQDRIARRHGPGPGSPPPGSDAPPTARPSSRGPTLRGAPGGRPRYEPGQ